MINEIKALAEKKGDKLEVVSIDRLQRMKDEIDRFQSEENLDGFQQWVVNNLYKFAYEKAYK